MPHVGDLETLTATFYKPAAPTLADPSAVTFLIERPDETILTVSAPTHVSLGVYSYELSITQAGTWQWRATGTGDVQVVGEGAFDVPAPSF